MVGIRSLKQQRSWPRGLRPKRKQARYNIYYNYEEEKHKENAHNDDNSDDEEEADGKGQRTPKKVLWRVTCGTKEGVLHIRRLQRGELCIRYNGDWISPADFETRGGRGSAKKWKTSIYHNNKPLEFFFKRGDLSTRGFKFKKTPLAKDKVLALSVGDSEAHSSAETEEDDAEENRCELDPIVITDDEDVMEDEGEGEKTVEVKESEENKIDDEDLTAAVEHAEDQPALKEMHPNISAKFPQISAYPVVAIERLPLAGWDVSDPQVLSDEEADSDEESEVTDDSSSEENAVNVTTVPMPSLSLEHVAVQENKEKLAQSGEIHDKQTNAKCTVDESNSKDWTDCSTLSNHIVIKENVVQMEKSPNGKINGEGKKDLERSRVHEKTNATSNVAQKQRLNEENLEQIIKPLSEHNTAKLQDGMPSSVRASHRPHPASPHASTHASVDQMDLDQLRREKLKKQLKVLQLQEEYYTFKLNKLKEKK